MGFSISIKPENTHASSTFNACVGVLYIRPGSGDSGSLVVNVLFAKVDCLGG